MSKIIEDEIKQGVEIDGEIKEYAFDLNEFFSTNEKEILNIALRLISFRRFS